MSSLEDLLKKTKGVTLEDVLSKAKGVDFDEVLNKTRSVAEAVTKYSSDRLEISRRKVEILNLKNKLSRAYEQFGKICYSQYNGDLIDEEEKNQIFTEITDLNSKIFTIETEIQQPFGSAVDVEDEMEVENVTNVENAETTENVENFETTENE